MLEAPSRAIVSIGAELIRHRFLDEGDAHSLFAKRGYHLLRDGYYLPIPESRDVGDGFWDSSSEMVGIEIDDRAALRLIEQDLTPYLAEFRETFELHGSPEDGRFYLLNGMFMAVDAHVYYGLIRSLKPKRIIEIGAGFSTLLACQAVSRNRLEGSDSELIAIEPYPSEMLQRGGGNLSRLISRKVQTVALEEFECLRAGDVLFIDSSHVLKAGGDVQFEFLELLPRLKPGVYVHVHDISLPRQYPRRFYDHHFYWNEQYLLQAFLTYNHRFEVVWPGNYIMVRYPKRLRSAIPEISETLAKYPQTEPVSFWMRVRE